MTGYGTGILIEAGAQVNDGNYKFIFASNGFAFQATGNIKGSAKNKLNIDITNGYFKFNNTNSTIENVILNQRYDDDKWQLYEWNGFKAINSEMHLYRLPMYIKGPYVLDNSVLSIDGGGNLNYQTGLYMDNAWTVGQYHITNNSVLEVKNFNMHWRSKGITLGYGISALADRGSKVRVIGDGTGGLNVNEGSFVFDNATLEASDHSGAHFAAQNKANTNIIFKGDSLVETPASSNADNGLGESGKNYIVLGGSHLVKYASDYYSGRAIPVNGDEHGNEKLSLFTLRDSDMNILKPVDKNGNAYDYSVKNKSSDGEKHVWVPSEKVVFKLNDISGKFADGTSEDKEVLAIRGYNINTAKNANGRDVQLPQNPTSESGKTFVGWFYDDGTGEKPFDKDEKILKETVVYAKWSGTAKSKIMLYDLNNGTGEKPTVVAIDEGAKEGKVLSISEVQKINSKFSVEGKTFSHWSKDKDGNEKVESGQMIDFGENESMTLYANWKRSEYTVAFSANGGTFKDDSPFKKDDTKAFFTVEKSDVHGEIATVNEKLLHGETLSDFLTRAGINGAARPNANTAQRKHHTVRFTAGFFGNTYSWYLDQDAIKTANAYRKVTGDTIYYIGWDMNPDVQDINADVDIKGDLYSGSKDNSIKTKILMEQDALSIVGDITTDEIKDKMQSIEALYPTDKEIEISELKTSFTATIEIPDGLKMPDDITPAESGMNGIFKISDVQKVDNKIVVGFEIVDKTIDTYKKLKEEVAKTDKYLSIRIDGFTLDKEKVVDRQYMTVKGDVTGKFSAFAQAGNTVKKFSFNFKAKQSDEGRDEKSTQADVIQMSVLPVMPEKDKLLADILIGDDSGDKSLYSADMDKEITYTGKVNVKPIKDKIKLLDSTYNEDRKNITLDSVYSAFDLEVSLPKGLSTTNSTSVQFQENDLFEIKSGDVKIEKDKVNVKMTLKKSYTSFKDLFDDVTGVTDDLYMNISSVAFTSDAKDGEKYTVKASLNGEFKGVANTGNKEKVFFFKWDAVQDPVGMDIEQPAGDMETIQYTVQAKKIKEKDKIEKVDPKEKDETDKKSSVKTGDERNVYVYFAILVAMLIATAALMRKKEGFKE